MSRLLAAVNNLLMPRHGRTSRFGLWAPIIALLGTVVLASGALAQNEEENEEAPQIYADSLTHVEDWGSYAVSIANERLYFGSGNRLIIADASNRSQPREISRLQLPYLVRDVHVTGEYAYVANDAGGLRIIDITDPVEPSEVASLSFEDRVDAVDVQGEHAYVAARSAGVHILNVSSPDRPEKVGHYETDEQAAGLVAEDSLLHVAATYGGHRILDVSDPANPEEIGFAIRGSYDQGYSWDVAVEGDDAYVANVEIGLRRVDVSNPAEKAPTVEIQQTVRYTNDNRYRYEVLDRPAAVEVQGGFAYVADQNAGLRVLDLSDPDTLRIVGTVDTPGRALDVAVSGNTAFVADKYAGIRVIDVSDPFGPKEIGFWDADQHAVQVTLRSQGLFLGDRENGLWLLDTESPNEPTPVGFHHLPHLSAFAVVGDRALTGDGKGELQLLDFSDPRQPRAQGTLSLPAPAEAIHLENHHAYVAAREEGVRIIDISDPNGPKEIGAYVPERRRDPVRGAEYRYYPNPPSAWGLTFGEEIAYVSFDDGIHVIDVSDPTDPQRIGRFAHSHRAMQSTLVGSHLYVAFDDGLHVLDVSDPARPKEIGFLDTPSFARDVVVRDDHAFVADLTGGLIVADVSDPSAPERLSTLAIERARLVDIAVDGNGHVYGAATSGGLRVFGVADPSSPRLLTSN